MRAAPSATIDEVAVVIIGGGIIGCSIAYHLAKRGITDVLVLERNQLASGATARAAGLICHARSDTSTIHMVKRTLAAIEEMEALLEEKIDFHPVGSVRAISPRRGSVNWKKWKRASRQRASNFRRLLLPKRSASAHG